MPKQVKSSSWFEVDREGLSKLLERKGKAFVLFELVQNAWDTNAGKVEVSIGEPKGGIVEVTVSDDDPDGFKDISHAWTLFAESEKKGDPGKRGRFNLGEKLVLAACLSATLTTTRGSVAWDANGRHEVRGATKKGSVFRASVKMTPEEREEVLQAVRALMPPIGSTTVVNGEELLAWKPLRTVTMQLPTEISDENGFLRRSARKTLVEIHRVKPGEVATIYEMGIPVVESGDKFHVNVMQKVPLNTERDNVTPAFLKTLRTLVLNETHDVLDEEDSTEEWVRAAASDERCSAEAIKTVADLRFGDMKVAADPSDPEGTKIALSKGYEIVFAGALSKGEWANVRKAGAILPAGQVTPSNKGDFVGSSPVEQSRSMMEVESLTKELAWELIGVRDLEVEFLSSPESTTLADFSKERKVLRYNVARLGPAWFDKVMSLGAMADVLDLILHEFGHWISGDHRSALYHEGLSKLGAKMTVLALERPEIFRRG